MNVQIRAAFKGADSMTPGTGGMIEEGLATVVPTSGADPNSKIAMEVVNIVTTVGSIMEEGNMAILTSIVEVNMATVVVASLMVEADGTIEGRNLIGIKARTMDSPDVVPEVEKAPNVAVKDLLQWIEKKFVVLRRKVVVHPVVARVDPTTAGLHGRPRTEGNAQTDARDKRNSNLNHYEKKTKNHDDKNSHRH